jgi:YVTN family beta-propeller protein
MRGMWLACWVSVMLAFGAPAQAAGAQRLYVAATATDKLYIVDAATNDIINTLTVGKDPHGLALTENGRWVWVAIDGGIVKVDAVQQKVVASFPLGDLQQELEITKDGRFLYTGKIGDGCYEVFDTVQQKVIAGMPVDGHPHNIVRAANDDRYMYGAPLSLPPGTFPPPAKDAADKYCDPARAGRSSSSDKIYVFDTRTHRTVGTIAVGTAPRPMAVSADGKRLYSDVDGLVGFVVIDTAKRAVVERVTCPQLTEEQKTTPSRGHGLGITRDQRELWAVSTLHNVVNVYDRTAEKVKFVTQIAVDGSPHWVSFSPDGRYGYISLTDTDKVAVIDTASHKVVRNIELPKGAGPKTTDAGSVASN